MRFPMRRLEFGFWLIALTWAIMAFWPAWYWYDAGTMRVDDTRSGSEIELLYLGGPRRDFRGGYSVVIRDADTNGVAFEDRSKIFQYRAGATRPTPLTLSWWAPGISEPIPPGSYVIETCWTIYGAFYGLSAPKTTCSTSNIFKVTP